MKFGSSWNTREQYERHMETEFGSPGRKGSMIARRYQQMQEHVRMSRSVPPMTLGAQ